MLHSGELVALVVGGSYRGFIHTEWNLRKWSCSLCLVTVLFHQLPLHIVLRISYLCLFDFALSAPHWGLTPQLRVMPDVLQKAQV